MDYYKPTYSQLTPPSSQQQPAGALTYASSSNQLYYVGMDGFLYYFKSINSWQYSYNEVPKTELLNQTLRISGTKLACVGNKIYYIGKQLGDGEYRIHALIDNNGVWSTVSPSHSANILNNQTLASQVQPNANSEIAVSPNGKYIAYIGNDSKVYYYNYVDNGWNYTYNKPISTPAISQASNSLQYTNNNQLFFVSWWGDLGRPSGDKKVHYYNFQQSFCENSSIRLIEPNYKVVSAVRNNTGDEASQNAEGITQVLGMKAFGNSENFNITIYPNPASKEINIDLPIELQGIGLKYHLTNSLGNIVKQGTIDLKSNIIYTQDLPAGVYIFSIFENTKNIRENYKIVIQK